MPKNKDEAYQFLNYLLRPDVVAHISDHVFYANANKAATPLVSAEVRDNPGGFILRRTFVRSCSL